jgi:ComF family protein
MSCGSVIDVANKSGLCAACRKRLVTAKNNYCRACGRIFEEKMPGGLLCVDCNKNEHSYERAAGFCAYGDVSNKIIGNLKTRKKMSYAKNIAYHIAGNLRAKNFPTEEMDFLIPIPLTKKKEQRRGFNQSELIASHLSTLIDLPLAKGLLVKIKETPDTKKLSEENRLTTRKGVFKVNDPGALLAGKTVLIIDDVFTTGTTAEVSAATMKEAGCERVYFASFTTRMANTKDGEGR